MKRDRYNVNKICVYGGCVLAVPDITEQNGLETKSPAEESMKIW